MDETLDQLRALREHAPRAAMATLVGTHGATPKKEGAKMFVGEGGRILGSVTIGGCVDARVVQEAEDVLRDGEARLVSMPLGDEDAWEMGLTCGGTVDVLVERVDFRAGGGAAAAYDRAAAELRAGRSVVVAALLEGSEGTRLVVRADGGTELSLGDAALDAAVAEQARAVLAAAGGSRVVQATSGAHTVDAFLDVLSPPLTLAVVGATHLAMPLARLAKDVGLRVVVIDPRERFATRARFPDADELHVGMASEIVASLPLGPSTLVVLVAHDYKVELPVLRAVLPHDVGYVGVLGSRRRGAALREMLAAELTPEQVARVHLPIGLDIGARSMPEIALAILAEAIAVARGRGGGSLRERDGAS